MPVGKYPTFAACVADNQDKENPQAYCGSLEAATQKSEQRGALGKILEGLAKFFSPEDPNRELAEELTKGVETLADGVEKLVATGDRIAVVKQVAIAKVDVERRLVYGVVYEPNVADAHGDMMTAGEIEKACHGFAERYALLEGETGVDHLSQVGRDQLPIVENFIAPTDYKLGKQIVKAGTWVMVAKAKDEQLWKDVKAGTYTGWSFEGYGRRIAAA